MEKILSDWKEKLINDGLEECKSLVSKQKGTMFDFYTGAIEGFEKCKGLKSLKDFEREMEIFHRKEFNLTERYYKKQSTEETLKKIWHIKGIRAQIEYVYDHLKAMNYLLKKEG